MRSGAQAAHTPTASRRKVLSVASTRLISEAPPYAGLAKWGMVSLPSLGAGGPLAPSENGAVRLEPVPLFPSTLPPLSTLLSTEALSLSMEASPRSAPHSKLRGNFGTNEARTACDAESSPTLPLDYSEAAKMLAVQPTAALDKNQSEFASSHARRHQCPSCPKRFDKSVLRVHAT